MFRQTAGQKCKLCVVGSDADNGKRTFERLNRPPRHHTDLDPVCPFFRPCKRGPLELLSSHFGGWLLRSRRVRVRLFLVLCLAGLVERQVTGLAVGEVNGQKYQKLTFVGTIIPWTGRLFPTMLCGLPLVP